jgi:hypothetical protein
MTFILSSGLIVLPDGTIVKITIQRLSLYECITNRLNTPWVAM